MNEEAKVKIKQVKDIFIATDNLQYILNKLKRIRQLSVIDEYENDPDCLLVTGETGVGKSYFIKQYLKRNERYEIADADGERTIVPVLYCNLPKAKHPKPVAAHLLRKLGDGLSGAYGDLEALTARLCVQLREAKVELIIIDEFQHAIETTNKQVIQDIGDWIKLLIAETRIPIAFFGVPWCKPILDINKQLKRRVRKNNLKIENYTLGNFVDFQMFIQNVEEGLPIKVSEPLWHAETAFRLFAASSGNLGKLMDNIIKEAAFDAIFDGSEYLTKEHLINAMGENLGILEDVNPFNLEINKVIALQHDSDSYWNDQAKIKQSRVVDATYAKVKYSDLDLKSILSKR